MENEISSNKESEEDTFDKVSRYGMILFFAIELITPCFLGIKEVARWGFVYHVGILIGSFILAVIVRLLSKHLKSALMFMGIVVLVLLSILLVKMILFG